MEGVPMARAGVTHQQIFEAWFKTKTTYIPHPCVKGAVIFSTILSIAWVPHETAWRHL
jgi:hypothetical protein